MRALLPDAVDTRTLTAEACASAALALVQQPLIWEALHTLQLLSEAVTDNPHDAARLAAEIRSIFDGTSQWTDLEAVRVGELLDTVDRTARGWAAIAHQIAIAGPPQMFSQPGPHHPVG